MEQIDLFSSPSSITQKNNYGEAYEHLYRLCYTRILSHKFDSEKHKFYQPNIPHRESFLLEMELKSAIESVLKPARKARKFDREHPELRIKTGNF